MITPSFALTATERVLPRMALDFTTASLDSRVTFTRTGNTATVTNSSGVIVGINADLPRFDFDPTTLVCKGLLIEEARTNALLNSLIDGTDLATQLVTVTAAARTLSFYGTGTVVLSGAHSATVVGAGAYPTRTTLTFTPIAGVLTLTVTGTVQFAQLELGAFPTSYIPTEATAVTRNADVATMTGTNFSDWFNASEGAFAVWCSVPASAIAFPALSVTDGTSAERIIINILSNRNGTSFRVVDGGGDQANLTNVANWVAGQQLKTVVAYKLDSFATALNGIATSTDTSGTIPTVSRLGIGNSFLASPAVTSSSHFQKLFYWPQRLTNAEVQAFSK
jgi:hypothetical protein